MATTLSPIKVSVNISNIVSGAIDSVRKIRSTETARKEAEFQKAVAAGMTYDAQVKFRKQQLENERQSTFSDSEFITSLEVSIENTKKLARFEKIRTKYQNALDAYVTGKQSLSDNIAILNDLISGENDPEFSKQLKVELSKLKVDQYNNEVFAVQNRALVAQRDLSVPMIESSIAEIQSKKALAAINENEDEVGKWEETLTALMTSKSKITIQNKQNDITYNTNRNNLKTTQQLALINDYVDSADNKSSFVLDGVAYASERDYWERERDAVVASPNFWNALENDVEAETSRIASLSSSGQIPVNRVQDVSNFYASLKTQPGFALYADKIEQTRVKTVDNYINEQAAFIEAEADQTQDYAKADKLFTELERKFGVQLSRPAQTGEKTFTDTARTDLATLPTAAAAEGTPSENNYVVRQGDTLARIALKSGVSLREIQSLNPDIKDINLIQPDQQIRLPSTPVTTTTNKPMTVSPMTPAVPVPVAPTVTPTSTATPVAKPSSAYQGVSLTDYLVSVGKGGSFAERKALAQQSGISDYVGSEKQNTELLKKTRGF